jgi:hypothetical protein
MYNAMVTQGYVYYEINTNVDIKFNVHDIFLE